MRTIVLLLTVIIAACGTQGPSAGSTASPDALRAFYVGLAALQVGDDVRAKDELTKATHLAPTEPAAWVNFGILQIRHKDFDGAAQSLERARTLADKNPKIYETIALLEKQRGNFDASQSNLQKAIDLDANNVKAMYALAKEKERQTDDTAARKLYEKILRVKPDNLETQIEAVRLAAKQNDMAGVRQIVADIGRPERIWENEIYRQFGALNAAVSADDARSVVTQVSFLRNMLLRDSRFRSSVDEVKYSDTTVGEPFTKPLVLQTPRSSPAPADKGLQFKAESESPNTRASKVIYLAGDDKPIIALGGITDLQIQGQVLSLSIMNESGIAVLDYDYDFRNDVAVAGPDGLRLYRNNGRGFDDVTPQTRLPSELTKRSYQGLWVLDLESDGDLDLIAGSSEPIVLQNNSDGTFQRVRGFEKIEGLKHFQAADLDEDGDSDAVLLDADGKVHFFSNERGGLYVEKSLTTDLAEVRAFTIGDIGSDGKLDVIVVDGRIIQLNYDAATASWQSKVIVPQHAHDGVHTVLFDDLDNNGAGDIILSGGGAGTRFWLADGDSFSEDGRIDEAVTSVADMNDDGRLDLVGYFGGVLLNSGTKNYNWQTVRPRAAKTTGDQRVNSFGIGGELELRAGSLLQKRLIAEPVVHFGLGENASADVLRVVWQNGFVQAEFDLKPNQTIAAEQRLKGSCPHLFAFDGEKFKLVKDAPPWSPALGLKINAQDIFGVLETEEWFKIPGEALKPTAQNYYELRITGEYWESFYLDRYSLLAVDHPDFTEVFTDERFAIPPAPLEVFTTGVTQAFASAKDDKGNDVATVVRTLDEKYLDGFERGTFQGVAEDHFVELELPDNAPADGRIAIVADGWVHPTDASINVQLGQSSREKPRSLSLEVRGDDGTWKVEKENLGFPAGKMKTILVDLPSGTRAARLRTNMEIFWDRLAWGIYEDGKHNSTTRLELDSSELRYRGFSVIEKVDDSSPEKPDYDKLLTTGQRWRDMEGYFTRFGDVRELLLQADDRFVLMNAGDELVLKFTALPPPALGFKREFVLIGDGWIKDGDLNSVFSKTLLPLPTHASNDYSKPPTTLENDPVYQQHKADWMYFHTRYVSPDAFWNALR